MGSSCRPKSLLLLRCVICQEGWRGKGRPSQAWTLPPSCFIPSTVLGWLGLAQGLKSPNQSCIFNTPAHPSSLRTQSQPGHTVSKATCPRFTDPVKKEFDISTHKHARLTPPSGFTQNYLIGAQNEQKSREIQTQKTVNQRQEQPGQTAGSWRASWTWSGYCLPLNPRQCQPLVPNEVH